MEIIERYVAIDNKCAWPNLTLMPDGAIAAVIFGEPCHGQWEGDAECWVSADGGRFWTLAGIAAPHAPATNRMNVAAGLAGDGALVVLCSGWSNRPPRGQPRSPSEGVVLAPWVCRSNDGGRTWTQHEGPRLPADAAVRDEQGRLCDCPIPFGNIAALPGGRLAVSAYNQGRSFIYYSDDDGRTWIDPVMIGGHPGRFYETDLLHLGGGRLLAAARVHEPSAHVEMLYSEDAGRTWTNRGPVTLGRQIPAHLLRLADGRILFCYGVRNWGLLGVCACVSEDEGLSWDAPRVLFQTDLVDGGYPATVQLADGTLVTAYYCRAIPMHQRYHMGVLRWRLD